MARRRADAAHWRGDEFFGDGVPGPGCGRLADQVVHADARSRPRGACDTRGSTHYLPAHRPFLHTGALFKPRRPLARETIAAASGDGLPGSSAHTLPAAAAPARGPRHRAGASVGSAALSRG